MHLAVMPILLFALNMIDALLTLYWVRNGFATEGNQLMAGLLDMGDMPFLVVKVAVGAVAAFVLLRWSNFRLARYGVIAALAVYIGLMGIHLLTGLAAFGYVSATTIRELVDLPSSFFAFFM
jgi:Domain of unknown function (DUF5658)